MTIFDWTAIGVVCVLAMIICARIMRNGLTTLEDDRNRYLEKIQAGERRLAEERKNISSSEHMAIMRAALEDLVRLDGSPQQWTVAGEGRVLELRTPVTVWKIELLMREKSLRSTNRVLHGASRWLLSGGGHFENHADPASLMGSLNRHLHDAEDEPAPEPEHLARRLSGIHSARLRL